MLHESILQKAEILPGQFISQIPSLPALLKEGKDGTVDYVTDGKVSVGDQIKVFPFTEVEVAEVVKSRPAKGDWSANVYKGMNPTWSKVRLKNG